MPRRKNHYKDRNKGKAPTVFQAALRLLPSRTAIVHKDGLFCGVHRLSEREFIRGSYHALAADAAVSLLAELSAWRRKIQTVEE